MLTFCSELEESIEKPTHWDVDKAASSDRCIGRLPRTDRRTRRDRGCGVGRAVGRLVELRRRKGEGEMVVAVS